MINIPSYIKDPSYRYRMPALQIKVEGKRNGIRTKFLNLFEVAKCLGVPPEYLLRYFGAEFGAIIEFKQAEQKAMLNGGLRREDLQSSLDHFIEKFVLCPKCKYPEINIRIKKNELYSDCKACGEVRKMDMTHKIVNFILKSPPPNSTKQMTNKKHETGPKKVGKKKKQTLSLKSPEIQECLERLLSENDLTRAGDILTNIGASRDYESDIRAYLMFKGIFGNNLNILMKNKEIQALNILKQYSSACAEDFIMAFAMVYGQDETWNEKVATSLCLFYDNDLISEEFFDSWKKDDVDFNESSPVYNEEALLAVIKNSAEFFKWLETAEVDDDDDEEEEDEENKVEENKTEESKVAENKVEENKGTGKVNENEEKKEEKPQNNGEDVHKNQILVGKTAEIGKTDDLISKLKDVGDFNIDDI